MNETENRYRDKLVEDIKLILTDWNPLGSRKDKVKDLNNYETEAVDILFHLETGIMFPKKGNPQTRARRIVKRVLNEAFYLSITDEECEEHSIKILNLIRQKNQ